MFRRESKPGWKRWRSSQRFTGKIFPSPKCSGALKGKFQEAFSYCPKNRRGLDKSVDLLLSRSDLPSSSLWKLDVDWNQSRKSEHSWIFGNGFDLQAGSAVGNVLYLDNPWQTKSSIWGFWEAGRACVEVFQGESKARLIPMFSCLDPYLSISIRVKCGISVGRQAGKFRDYWEFHKIHNKNVAANGKCCQRKAWVCWIQAFSCRWEFFQDQQMTTLKVKSHLNTLQNMMDFN